MTASSRSRDTNVSCACHWTVNVAASQGRGKMYADAYSISPGGVFVPPESPIRTPQDLRNVPISVGHQSGSHCYDAGARAVPAAQRDQALLRRRDSLRPHGESPIARSGRRALQRSLLLRRAARFPQGHRYDVHDRLDDHRRSGPRRRAQVFPRAAPRAARHRSQKLHTHHYAKEFPQRFRSEIDTRRWGPGERIVFEPYTREVEESFKWIAEREIFAPGTMGAGKYDELVFR